MFNAAIERGLANFRASRTPLVPQDAKKIIQMKQWEMAHFREVYWPRTLLNESLTNQEISDWNKLVRKNRKLIKKAPDSEKLDLLCELWEIAL
jgi:hypothetical protein